jgi:hypothetical protein
VGTTTLTTNLYFAGYSFVTNVSFFDYRESDTGQVVQVNVAALNTWLTNRVLLPTNGVNYFFPIFSPLPYTGAELGGEQYTLLNTTGGTAKGHSINSIYVYNNVPLTTSQLPAVRIINGQQLPTNGLTVVTPQPMYVKGNYNTTTNGINFSLTLGNTTNTYPAGLFADAVTILSSSWNDSLYSSGYAENLRTPVDTVINAATLEGIVPSSNISPTHYSGGVENFLRLLEAWSGSITLTYNGSIVVLFPSQYATNYYGGGYYGVPRRQWGFDNNFNQANKLPPLTPQMRQTVRGNWATW